jgi:hypothetical protein
LARATARGLSRARIAGFAARPEAERDTADGGQALPADEAGQAGREGGSPHLTLTGFSGPLDHLLTLARAQKIDLSDISLTALLDQLTAALHQAPAAVPLGQKADWVVMAAWLVQLRTRLLLPADAPGQRDAAAEVDQLRTRLIALEDIQALAFWLEHRPQLGHDVFARGRPEFFGHAVEAWPGDRHGGIPLGQPGAVRRRNSSRYDGALSGTAVRTLCRCRGPRAHPPASSGNP